MGSLIYQTLGYPDALHRAYTADTCRDGAADSSGYIAAGAELVQAHSYGANRIRLAYGLQDKVEAINGQAVKLAREAKEIAGKDVLIAGSISPIELLDYPNETLQAEALQLIRGGLFKSRRVPSRDGVSICSFSRRFRRSPNSAPRSTLCARCRLADCGADDLCRGRAYSDGRHRAGRRGAHSGCAGSRCHWHELQHRTTNGPRYSAPYPSWSMCRCHPAELASPSAWVDGSSTRWLA